MGKDKIWDAKEQSARRCKLEYDVMQLQMELQHEMDLRCVFENANDDAVMVLADLPSHLSVGARKLLLEVATLEFAVCRLEEQMASLEWQLLTERLQRKAYEEAGLRFLAENSASCSKRLTVDEPSTSTYPFKPPSPVEPASPDNVFQGHREHVFMSSSSSTELPASSGGSRPRDSVSIVDDEVVLMSWEEDNKSPSFQKWESRADPCARPAQASRPNQISEQMVQCMMDIYQHLSDRRSKPLAEMPPPVSAPSTSASSFLSFARSPLVDLRAAGVGACDPYATHERLLWPADIGPYARSLEVSCMLVGKEQLDYAANALLRFKHLVEQLSKVDPGTMAHAEKLAFWINVYNALMMHAFLAYGTDSKYHSLMQKANYTFGGHSFNAMTIEVALLKNQRAIHRHQHRPSLFRRIELSEPQQKFAINHPEPLVAFALSFGAWSCPAIRVYTPDKVHEQLEYSLRSFIQASVGVNKRGKLLIPRLLYAHARDVYATSIPDWICEHLTSSQQEFAQGCLRQRKDRYLSSNNVVVVPFESRFRYLFLPAQSA